MLEGKKSAPGWREGGLSVRVWCGLVQTLVISLSLSSTGLIWESLNYACWFLRLPVLTLIVCGVSACPVTDQTRARCPNRSLISWNSRVVGEASLQLASHSTPLEAPRVQVSPRWPYEMTRKQPNTYLPFMGLQLGLPRTVEQAEYCSTPENTIHRG